MGRWEDLQCRLFHLGYLGEELEYFAGTSRGAWLYRQIAQETARVAEIARANAGEVEQASTYYADSGL
ncbi:hypothetical protein [Actinokineospora cianjurensis]|uniref:Uncharacterized protein n=1 Tax=Actinokineospora cianjurensis TaxID=585224 RepID=A0A421B2N2_9PSEU|nr:hypothetical protein [Actinokineospora cianjurensis]RLK58686.1 hypothetical protein CLV68_3159 [Actinokineospora cianjurensis]